MTDYKGRARQKNPLAVLLGFALRDLRDELKCSAEEIAIALEISASSYRLIESGFAAVPPYYVTKLVMTFRKLNWSRLAQLLVAIQLVEKAKPSTDQMRQVIKEVGGHLAPPRSDLWLQFERVCDLLSSDLSRKVVRTRLVQSGLISGLVRYLSEPDRTSESGATAPGMVWVQTAMQKLSPYYFELLVSQVNALEHFPPRATPEALKQWEVQNPHRFQRIYGIMQSSELLIAESEEFNWGYVYRDDFGGIYLLSFEDASVVKDRIKALHKKLTARRLRHRASSTKPENIATFVKRNVIMKSIDSCSASEKQSLKSLLRYDVAKGELLPLANPDPESPVLQLRNAWLYQMKDTGNVVAFVDDKSQNATNPYQATVLSSRATRILLEHLEAIWQHEPKRRSLGLASNSPAA